ncbi:hypothetical protein CY34DRAFT_797067 [Suillus luteus UH-Slu-Lm8-n1]|uniref:Uncharacterized protein n=1 Tax=Suillus luteus UH-Slu-Lm8-n1 TaxID=930992 RepID=A0A0D0AHN6_9AGAM|nr:hypothetical protein CY34DRAFT_797067 [Suillus luteus UH-Slu-Lm8-n1]
MCVIPASSGQLVVLDEPGVNAQLVDLYTSAAHALMRLITETHGPCTASGALNRSRCPLFK